MALPVTLIPVALSAIRSLVLLNRKIGKVAVLSRLDNDLPIFLPPIPKNIIRKSTDRARMEAAFSGPTPERAALEARGLSELFDRFLIKEGMDEERHHDLVFQFLSVFYEIEDANTGAVAPAAASDTTGLDQYLVRSARLGEGPAGLQILRATAETLVDFLGENATVFLARSQHQLVLSTVLREFAAETDLETDSPERIVKILLGSVAVAATDDSQTLSDKPLAVLLFASLGQVRRDIGDDFVSRIVSRDGFDAVVSDWLTRVATDDHLIELVAGLKDLDDGQYNPADPATLPAALQPVFGVLSETLKTVGGHIGAAKPLNGEDAFRDVFGAVLTGLTDHSAALLQDELEGRKLMAQVLSATLVQLGNHPAVKADALAAPVFGAMLDLMAQVLPDLDNAEALSRVELVVQDLALRIASAPFQAAMADVTDRRGAAFTDALVAELVGVLGSRAELLAQGLDGHAQSAMQALLTAAPDLLDRGLNRATITDLFSDIVGLIYPEDTPEGGFAAEVLPVLLPLFDGLGATGKRLGAAEIETVIRAYVGNFDANRPVWQEIFDRDLLPVLIGAVSAGVSDMAAPARLPAPVLADLVSAALVATGRNALTLAERPDAGADPQAVIGALVRQQTARAMTRALNRLGHGSDASQLPQLAERALDMLLSSAAGAPPTDAELDAFLSEQIRLFKLG